MLEKWKKIEKVVFYFFKKIEEFQAIAAQGTSPQHPLVNIVKYYLHLCPTLITLPVVAL